MASSASACWMRATRSRTISGPMRFIGGAEISANTTAPSLRTWIVSSEPAASRMCDLFMRITFLGRASGSRRLASSLDRRARPRPWSATWSSRRADTDTGPGVRRDPGTPGVQTRAFHGRERSGRDATVSCYSNQHPLKETVMTTSTRLAHQPGDGRRHRPPRGLRGDRRRDAALRRGRRGAAGPPAARLPGVLVQLAPADRTARQGRLPRRRARPARLQPVVEARRLRRLHRRQARPRRPRPHPRARCRVRDGGRPRLGRNGRLDPGDEPPRGRRPARHPQRRPPAQAQRGAAQPASAPEDLVLLLLPVPGAARSAARAAGTGGSSSASCAPPARRTRRRSSIATSRRGPSQGRRRR